MHLAAPDLCVHWTRVHPSAYRSTASVKRLRCLRAAGPVNPTAVIKRFGDNLILYCEVRIRRLGLRCVVRRITITPALVLVRLLAGSITCACRRWLAGAARWLGGRRGAATRTEAKPKAGCGCD